jgi:uncharacterized protein YyaL (SSP411 family)
MNNETTDRGAVPSPNRLAGESSPYLQQHAHNPVDWYPWGEEALARARDEDRPILLSIGYAACHWCHVMERESFEDPGVAAVMNENFVCIKVDREERPDLDDVYMRAVQMMTGHGGWPLTAFLTPDLEPFYGGTYFPPEPRHGMPAFTQVLLGVARAYVQQRDDIAATGRQLREHLQPWDASATAGSEPGAKLIYRAVMGQHDRFDPNYGGFGPAPKFPQTTQLMLHLRYAVGQGDAALLDEALFSLRQMAAGGIRDHVGGGFHRYSTDARWLVPHFEKMLYDNALLASAFLDAYRVDGGEDLAAAARTTLDWVRREMQDEGGGYYATLDADSEGVEGKFYVWGRDEIDRLLGEDAESFAAAYDIREGGNWEGASIPNTPRPLGHVAAEFGLHEDEFSVRLQGNLETLRNARDARIHPGLDDKILSDWNGLMIAAMARGYRVLGDVAYLESATAAAEFVLGRMVEDGRLLHTCRNGEARLNAYIDGYANMLWGCLELFESTFELHWLDHCERLADGMVELFLDSETGGFHFTGHDHESLIARPKIGHDGATPAGNAIAATCLLRLGRWTDRKRYTERGRETIAAFGEAMRRAPGGFGQMLLALESDLREHRELVVLGDPTDASVGAAVRAAWRSYAPGALVAVLDPGRDDIAAITARVPLLAGKAEVSDAARPLFFACRSYACGAPTADLEEALGELG